jgi:CRISPR-associated protein Cas1
MKMKKIPIKHRELIKYVEYAKVSVRKFGVVTTNKEVCEQLPVDTIGTLILGPGTSITSGAVNIISKSGCVLSFGAGGGLPQHASVFGYRSSKNANAQMRTCFDEKARLKAAFKLIKARNEIIKEFCEGVPVIEYENCNSVEEILLKEAHWAKKAYLETSIVSLGERHGMYKRDRPIALYNYFVYNAVHSVLMAYGYVPDVGVIHSRTRGGGLVFDIADVFKPALSLMQSSVAGLKKVDPNKVRGEVLVDSNRLQLRKRIQELLIRVFPGADKV